MASGQHMLAYRELIKMGYSPAQAAGIVGNLVQESSLNPAAVGDQGTAFGIAQWRGDRLAGLKNFASQQGTGWNDINTQLRYLDHELKGPESFAGRQLQAAKTPEDATAAFMHFERPQGYTRDNPTAGHGWGNRVQAARSVFGTSGDGDAGTGTPQMNGIGSAPMQSAPGGLGGLGGFVQGDEFGDIMRAVGLSMMSSPGNNWLQNVGDYLPALQLASEKRQKTQQEQDAIVGVLMKAGLSEEEARQVSVSPQAAQLALDQVTAQQQAQANTAFGSQIGGIAGGAPDPGMAPQAAGPGTQMPAGGDQGQNAWFSRSAAGQPSQAPQRPATGNRTADALIQRRQAIVDTIMQAGPNVSNDMVDRAKLQIGQIDKMLERIAPDAMPGEFGLKPDSESEARARAIKQSAPYLTDEQVVGVVTGRYTLDPAGGGLIDTATGLPVRAEQGQTGQPAGEQRRIGTLWEAIPNATGIGPAIGRTFDATLGQAAGMAGVEFGQAPKMVAAKQRFDAFARDIRQALALNSRGAIWEQQVNAKLVEPGIGTHPGAMEQKLIELNDYLGELIANERAVAADPSVPRKVAGEAKILAERMQRAKDRIGVPEGARSALDTGKPQAPLQAAPEGIDPEDWKYMTPKQRELWQN